MIGDTFDEYFSAYPEHVTYLLWPAVLPLLPGDYTLGTRHNGNTFMNVTWVDGHVTAESITKLVNGANGDIDWYYKADK